MLSRPFGPLELLIDFGLISGLLVVIQVLRSRSRLLQASQLPTPILAGFVALAGGHYALDVLPFSLRSDGTPYLEVYPGYLIAMIFASIALSRHPSTLSNREQLRNVGDTFLYNIMCYVGMYGIALLFSVVILEHMFPALPHGFGVLLPAGWVGGFGTASAFGTVLQQHGFDDALPLGYTSATAGVVFGISGGMALVHLGTKRGWTRLVGRPEVMPESFRTGFVPPAEREPLAQETTNGSAVETITWHLGLIGAAVGLGYLISIMLPAGHGIPLFALALPAGWFIRWILSLLGVGSSIDPRLMGRIGSSAADYLIAFGVASIALTVVVRYLVPLLLLFVLGVVFTVGMFWLGRRIFRNFWFERSLFAFGWTTGVLAISIALLRVVDPQGRSRTMEDYSVAWFVNSWLELAIVALLPVLIARGIVVVPMIVLLLVSACAILVSRLALRWSSRDPVGMRVGEAAAIAAPTP
ncbi:MAG: sodium/glutamate symporter [Gemmatimonadales bacterium]